VHGQFGNAVVVNERGRNHEDVEELMTVKPNVAFAWKKSLRNPQGIQQGSQNVQRAHEHQIAEARIEKAFGVQEVDGRKNSAQAEPHEDAGSEPTELRFPESVPQRHYDGRGTENEYDHQINYFGLKFAIETVI